MFFDVPYVKRSVRLNAVVTHLREFGMEESDFEQMSDVALDKLSHFLTLRVIEKQELEEEVENLKLRVIEKQELEMEVEDLKLEMDDFRQFTLQYLRARGM